MCLDRGLMSKRHNLEKKNLQSTDTGHKVAKRSWTSGYCLREEWLVDINCWIAANVGRNRFVLNVTKHGNSHGSMQHMVSM